MLILNVANIYRSVTIAAHKGYAYKYVIYTYSTLMFKVWT